MFLQHYRVRISPEAMNDIDDVYRYIAEEVFQPEAAKAYRRGIFDTIYKLYLMGGIRALSQNENLRRKYGHTVRTTGYKKMSIIYTVVDDLVLVHRVVAGSMII